MCLCTPSQQQHQEARQKNKHYDYTIVYAVILQTQTLSDFGSFRRRLGILFYKETTRKKKPLSHAGFVVPRLPRPESIDATAPQNANGHQQMHLTQLLDLKKGPKPTLVNVKKLICFRFDNISFHLRLNEL